MSSPEKIMELLLMLLILTLPQFDMDVEQCLPSLCFKTSVSSLHILDMSTPQILQAESASKQRTSNLACNSNFQNKKCPNSQWLETGHSSSSANADFRDCKASFTVVNYHQLTAMFIRSEVTSLFLNCKFLLNC